jgi:hypothetical protein
LHVRFIEKTEKLPAQKTGGLYKTDRTDALL